MAEKDGYSELRISLPDADKESLRHLANTNERLDGMLGLAVAFIQQGLGRRKLGDYVHMEAHEQAGAKKDREIARLKKELFETAGIWEQLVRTFHPESELESTGKSMPAYIFERVSNLIESEKSATEKLQETEKHLQTLQETTILRSEHEERIDTVSKEKQELQTQLQAETESVKRLNVKLSGQESEINELKTETGAQQAKIVSMQDRIELHRDNEKMWKDLYTQEYSKPFWRKILDSLIGRPDLPQTDTDETPPESKLDQDR